MRDLTVGWAVNAFGRKACQDATKSGKLLSRLLGYQNQPQTWDVYVWLPWEMFFARNFYQAEGEECQMF
jgi:hypothetical protein